MTFEDDFMRGQDDCAKGKPHADGQGEAYDRGYNAEYQHQQNMDALSSVKGFVWRMGNGHR